MKKIAKAKAIIPAKANPATSSKANSTHKKPKRLLPKVKWSIFLPTPVIGVDEAGRGCLAGPVFAAAVILDPASKVKAKFNDSKLLSEARREELFKIITSEHQFAVGIASVQEIESMNILWASMLAMERAVRSLANAGHILVDGNRQIPKMSEYSQTTLIQGDRRAQPVSAASIVAKVSRDRFMKELHGKFPHYGFAEHKGYGTEVHLQALRKFGHTEHHRLSFRGVLSGNVQGNIEGDVERTASSEIFDD